MGDINDRLYQNNKTAYRHNVNSFTIGLISKIKIIFAPIKVKLLIHITNFMEDTLDNYYNKNVIYEYLEKEFSLEQNENGEYDFTIKQMEKAIKKNEKNLNIDEQKYFNFVMNTGIINIIDWCNKKSIKLALKIHFVCICLAAGQASIDRFYK